MYASVVVLTYQSPSVGSYTYKIPEDLKPKIKIGQLVNVPFGSRNPSGLVVAVSNHPSVVSNLKPIGSILLEQPLLLPYQIKLLTWLSEYYLAPTVNCLEAMLPEIPKKLGSDSRSGSKMTSQTLVLVPSINRLPQTLAHFPKAKNHVLYHNQLKTSEKFQAWLKILSGQADYIFGSRSAIFAPCPNLKKIIIFDEHDGAYKDERSPYFDTITAAEKICILTGAELEIIDNSPKITTYFNHQKVIKTIAAKATKTKIVSMKEEKDAGNFSPLSQEAISQIRKTVAQKGKVLLFLNKKIESGQIYCKNCKYHEFARTQPKTCPNCNSENIWFNSLNVNSLALTVKRIVGNVVVNIIADVHDRSVISGQSLAVDIATSAIFYAPILRKYDLTCYIQTDNLLNIPDISTSEKFFSQIIDLKSLTKDNGTFITQTNNPQNTLLIDAAGGKYESFYNSQVSQRKLLSYPPFALLVKLTIKGKDDQKIKPKAEELIQSLEESAVKDQLPTVILGPYKPAFWHPISHYNIILKSPLKSYALLEREKTVKNLHTLLKPISGEFQITVEPISIN